MRELVAIINNCHIKTVTLYMIFGSERKIGSQIISHGSWKMGMFWEDFLLGQSILKDRFSILYVNSNQKSLYIGQIGVWEENLWYWRLGWRRSWFTYGKKSYRMKWLVSLTKSSLFLNLQYLSIKGSNGGGFEVFTKL